MKHVAVLVARLAVVALAACRDADAPAPVEVTRFPVTPNPDLDILILVDDTQDPADELALTEIPMCPADGDCYAVRADARACPDTPNHTRMDIQGTPPAGAYIHVRC